MSENLDDDSLEPWDPALLLKLGEAVVENSRKNGIPKEFIARMEKSFDRLREEVASAERENQKSEQGPGAKKSDPLVPWDEKTLDALSELSPDDVSGALGNSTPKLRSMNDAASDEASA